jgi:hypothetical protein
VFYLTILIAEIKMLDLSTKSIVNLQILEKEKPTSIKWHPRKENLAAIGYQNGMVSFIDVVTLESFTIELFIDEDDDLEKMTIDEREMVGIEDMAWDHGEDHLMVSFAHGKMGMIDFNGFSKEKTTWKFIYERQKQGNHCISWRENRSGDFVTSSRKMGIIKIFNVASKSPK